MSGDASLPKTRQPGKAHSRCEAGIGVFKARHEHKVAAGVVLGYTLACMVLG